MKVLMLGWELPPHNSGGLGVACYSLCKALSKKNIDIEFVVPYAGSYDVSFMNVRSVYSTHYEEALNRFEPYESYKYFNVKNLNNYLNISSEQNDYVKAVAKIVETLEFDIIHAHDWLTFRAALKAKEITGKPLILHVHSLESDRSGSNYGNPFVREIEQTIMYLADRIIAVSQKTKNQIIDEYGIPADKIAVIYNSIDIEDNIFDEVSANSYQYITKMREKGYKVVVNVSRMTIQKGLPHLLYAAKEVVAKMPKTLFLFVGDGDQFIELIELSAELGIAQNVIFAGFQRGKKWRDAYAIGNLFVMPSVSEPFGLTPLEAAASKTPSLVSRQTGITEIFKNCLKVDYWDIHEMANQISSVLANNTLADELSKNAFSEYQKLSWDSSADQLIDIYQRHLEKVAV